MSCRIAGAAKLASALVILLLLCNLDRAEGGARNASLAEVAMMPPRGWNSYNSFSWIISEAEFLDNARFVSEHLLKFGYEYVVVDFLWYRKLEPGASVWSAGHDVIDQWGRPAPDPARWPSSKDGTGFTQVAQQVHALGLKFGLHVMRGISTAAVQANTPILGAKGSPDNATGRPWLAADVAVPGTECRWMRACFMGINSSSEVGRAFVKSLYDQYASWGVDFIKHDCVFGVDDLRVDEIELVSQAILDTGRPIVYSLSPGVHATPDLGLKVANISNMYRVTADDWDTWSDLQTHFNVARDFAAAGLMGAPNSRGRSWPDLDMLPLGWLTDPGALVGPHRSCSLSPAEQRTQVSLWAMAKSPLMYGGDLRSIDAATLSLITNPLILDINAHSTDNHELLSTPSNKISNTVLTLTDCEAETPTKWFTKSVQGPHQADRVCWTGAALTERRWRKGGDMPLGCLNWTPTPNTNSSLLFTSVSQEADTVYETGFIRSSRQKGSCLVAEVLEVPDAPVKPSTRITTFTQCTGKSTQAWRLTAEGRLVNENTGLCATARSADGTRVWVARGAAGQVYYVAFFNLASSATSMSVSINTVIGEMDAPARLVCKGLDVWSGRDLGNVDDSLNASVEGHGAVVFSLTCSCFKG